MVPTSTPSEAAAIRLARQHFGITASAQKLPGEVDFNFYLKTESGGEFTLKWSRPGTDAADLDFQAKIMAHLAASGLPLDIPMPVPALDGRHFIELPDGQYLRLQKWVPGRMVAELNPRSAQVLRAWGRTCGLLSRHLAGFDHPAAHKDYKWDPGRTHFSKTYRPYIIGEKALALADYFWEMFETQALPHLPSLRKSVNYNDAHEHNLLANYHGENPTITGVIDFGDALFTQTVNELAIACAYACMYLPDPLRAASDVVRGYHEVFPLEEGELAVLFPLIAGRLLLSVAHSAYNKHHEPENQYLLVSEKPAWDLLEKFREIPPALAHYSFRHAAGFAPCPKAGFANLFFQKMQQEAALAPVIDFSGKQTTPLDLSVGSLDLGNNENFGNIRRFEKTIEQILENKQTGIGLGGYDETRPFYTTDAYKTEGNEGAQWRTVHLGMDVWTEAGTPVFSPLDGRLLSAKNNAADCDYGPTLILEHDLPNGEVFYTLYGHLSLASLDGKVPGAMVKKGEKIAEIGAPPINGNWPPHLHFQVILDRLGLDGDFPGVAYPHEAEVWKSLCPDPAPFFPVTHFPKGQLTEAELFSKRKKSLGRSLSISYREPLHIVRGFMQYLYDTTGRRYLDTVNNVPHVGHQHPRVVRAAERQMAVLNTNTRYLHENIALFAEELLATLPPELSVVHFVNSGSEANELALRMVEAFTGSREMISVEAGYHGNTGRCVEVSSYKFDGKGGKGAPPCTHVVPLPDVFRGIYGHGNLAGETYAAHVGEVVAHLRQQNRQVGGFICESIISCGGQIVLPKNYLPEAYRFVRTAGGLCIADEVQVGFGRPGDAFWAFEFQGVVPDIVTMGKPIGNGHPLGAVVTTEKVAAAFANGMEYFNTFGGNPVSCAIGREVLRIIRDEGLQNHAHITGRYLTDGLKGLRSRFPIIGDVRGHGLFLGFELVKNLETLAPATAEATYLANRMRQRGILMSTDGPFNNVLKIKPPMCFDKSNADFLLENLEMVLQEDFIKMG